MDEKLLEYSRLISTASQQEQLGADHALAFCQKVLPQLLAEIEILSRVQARMDAVFETVLSAPAEIVAPPKADRRKRRPAAKARKKKARIK